MRSFLRLACIACMLLCLFVCSERPAMAYVDPGSGLFMFQSFNSLLVGMLFFMRRRLKALFRRRPEPENVVALPERARHDIAA